MSVRDRVPLRLIERTDVHRTEFIHCRDDVATYEYCVRLVKRTEVIRQIDKIEETETLRSNSIRTFEKRTVCHFNDDHRCVLHGAVRAFENLQFDAIDFELQQKRRRGAQRIEHGVEPGFPDFTTINQFRKVFFRFRFLA
jgi:hypothetical protein